MSYDVEISGDDGYDIEEVFGDEVERVPTATATEAVKRVVQQAQKTRLPPPPFKVEPIGEGDELPSFEVADEGPIDVILGEVVQAASGKPAPFSPLASGDFPLLQKLQQKFAAALPATKVVRVDTEPTYDAFRAQRREPYLDELDHRLSELEDAFADHVADHHGHGRLARLEEAFARHLQGEEVLGEDADRVIDQALIGGERVPLSLPPWAAGKVDCWRDGDEVLCSIRLPGPDGKVRIATTGTPVERHEQEVMGYMDAAGIDPMHLLGVLPTMAAVLGGGSLVTQLAAAAPEILVRPEIRGESVFVGKMTPASDPTLAATMALCQRSQRGDKQARAEVERLQRTPAGKKLYDEASSRLAAGQAVKRSRMLRKVL